MPKTAKTTPARKPYKPMKPNQRLYLLTMIKDGLREDEMRERCAKHPTDPWELTEKQVDYWRSKVKHRFAEVAQAEVLDVVTTGFALRENRIKALNQLADRMLEDLLATDKAKERVWLERTKSVGSRQNFREFMEEEFNHHQLKEFRGLMDDIARETQGRVAKSEVITTVTGGLGYDGPLRIPADLLAPGFVEDYRDIRARNHTEYLEYGGRGSTKSTFISLMAIELMQNNPDVHMVALRQVANTLRDSVYAQLKWAIDELGQQDRWKCTVSPLEMTYLPTGQKIYFRGADDAGKLKSIKPAFGYIAIVWFEELDQFHGPEAVRKIEQSVLRGGELAWNFKSWNPPRTSGNWVNHYVQIPKESQFKHQSNYLTVPIEWLGQVFMDEAEHLRQVNPGAYEHEYLGVVNGAGGQVFENVKLRPITDEEIFGRKGKDGLMEGGFDRILPGIDWGYYPDPFAYVKQHFDANRRILYIYDELKAQKKSNRAVYDELIKSKKYDNSLVVIADSAEPKSIADFREYGAACRGAEKGPESVTYSMKWLQSLVQIVIDPVRCPESAQEFLDYELEQDKDGEYISEFPDKNNHFIDASRYGTNLIWRKRGQ